MMQLGADPGNTTFDSHLSRRGALGGLGTLLAMGAWPGARAAEAAGVEVKPIRFVAVNDFHHRDEGCDMWMEALFRQIGQTPEAAFCLGLGDLADQGSRSSLEAVKRAAALAKVPFYPCPGNHDLDESSVEGIYAETFPGQTNYLVREDGWQIVIIDTTEGNKWENVRISPQTLAWLDRTLPSLNPSAPTVLCTHFPLAAELKTCPLNADAVLARFIGHNLRGVFGGHYHGRTDHSRGAIRLVTNVCASRVRDNHDGDPAKGYLVIDGNAEGGLEVKFERFTGPSLR